MPLLRVVHMGSPLRRLFTLTHLLSSFASVAVHAQATMTSEYFNQLVNAQCPGYVAKMSKGVELAPIMAIRPVDVAAACECTAVAFASDTRLQAVLKREPSELAAAMQSAHLQAYLFGRLLTSVLSCLTPEFESSLAATAPE